MTIANNYAPVVTAANGSATVFTGSWNAIAAANLVVQLLNTTTGVYTTVTQGVGSTQYQVTTLTATGFSITFNTAPASGNNVIISRLTPAAQTIPYTTSRGFQGSVNEGSFDLLTAMIQENAYNNTKAISAPVGDSAANLILPIASIRAGYVLAFDSSGDVIVSTQTLATLQSTGTSAAAAAASATAAAASAATATTQATAAAASASVAAASVGPWAVATGTGDAIVATYSPAITSLTDGLLLTARVPGSNATTTPTFKANSTTAHTITKEGGIAVSIGDIPGNLAECIFRYNLANTRWELLNPLINQAVTTYQTTDSTNISCSQCPTQANLGSAISMTIPTKGQLRLALFAQLVATVATQQFIIGIRIGSTNYWPTVYSGIIGGTANYSVAAETGNSGSTISSTALASVTGQSGGLSSPAIYNLETVLDIVSNSIPTGAQTVQPIVARLLSSSGALTVEGTVQTSEFQIIAISFP